MLHRLLATFSLLIILGVSFAIAWRALPPPALQTDASGGTAAIGGPFALTDQTGKPRTEADYKGRWMLVYFGFTHCPDICPTGLAAITEALKELGPQGSGITPIFITLDPERDTQGVLKSYLAAFSPRLVGLTGSAEQVRQAAGAYKVYYAREETPDSELGYVINHSGFIYLMGPDGLYRTHFRHDEGADAIARRLRELLDQEPSPPK